MTSVAYILVALVGLALMAAAAFRMVYVPRLGRDESGEDEPMTPLQKRAWAGLAVGSAVCATLVALFVIRGTPIISADKVLRLALWGVMLAGGVLWSVVLRVMKMRERGVDMDERDRSILGSAPAVQSGAVLLVLAVWTVCLTEVYWQRGAVPVDYLSLIFFSCLISHLMALPVGVLLGYRRARHHAQG